MAARANRGFRIEGRPEPKADENIAVDYQLISEDYFSTLEIPLLAGRAFASTDTASGPRVAIVSRLMARKYFPGQEAIGKRIAFGDPHQQDSWHTIVGVVGDVPYESIGVAAVPLAYTPYRQNSEPWSQMAVVLRTRLDPTALAADLRKAILAVDPNQPITNVQSMEELMAAGVTRPRFTMLLIGTLAGIATLLAVAGVYGVMAYAVARRTHELGIRMALGAEARDVLKLIVRQGMTLTLLALASASSVLSLSCASSPNCSTGNVELRSAHLRRHFAPPRSGLAPRLLLAGTTRGASLTR